MPHTYPFPGMNPWLEDSKLWRGIRLSLINAIRDYLAPALAPRYFVDVEAHTYIATFPDAPPVETRYPDLAILDRGGHAVAVAPTATFASPKIIELPHETIEEVYLEIRLVPSGKVITVIEILSHTNKRGGADRRSYIHKREKFLDAYVNFVEIDLLRARKPMPVLEGSKSHYRIFIRRREDWHLGYLHEFQVRDRIPIFPLPLQLDDEEPPVDLGALLKGVYERGRYDLVIDYTAQPEQPLHRQDMAWIRQVLASQQT
ncbi:MAG: DUF4058 family protein [Anaerolineales bacterium]